MKLTYQAQVQQQHQDPGDPATTGNPADGPVPDGHGDDALISDILGAGPPGDADDGADEAEPPPRKKPAREEEVQEEEPEEPTPDDDDDDALEVPEEGEDEEEFEEAAEDPGKVTGKLAEARAALKGGDIDKAFLLAFGKKPEEVQPNNHVWTQWRAANKREEKKRQEERQAFEGEKAQAIQQFRAERLDINNTIEQLKPYQKYRDAEQAFERDGDPSHLVDIVQGITKMSYNEAQKIILTKTRRSPAEVAMQNKIAELERKLQENLGEREKQQQQQTAEQQYAADLAYIRGQVEGVVTKVPKFAERIHAILLKTRGPLGLTMTPQQAAERVLRAEKKRLASHPLIKKPAGKVPPKVTDAARRLAQRRKNASGGPPLRRDSQNNGAKNRDKETDDDIIQDILGAGKRRAS